MSRPADRIAALAARVEGTLEQAEEAGAERIRGPHHVGDESGIPLDTLRFGDVAVKLWRANGLPGGRLKVEVHWGAGGSVVWGALSAFELEAHAKNATKAARFAKRLEKLVERINDIEYQHVW